MDDIATAFAEACRSAFAALNAPIFTYVFNATTTTPFYTSTTDPGYYTTTTSTTAQPSWLDNVTYTTYPTTNTITFTT